MKLLVQVNKPQSCFVRLSKSVIAFEWFAKHADLFNNVPMTVDLVELFQNKSLINVIIISVCLIGAIVCGEQCTRRVV